MKLSLDKTNQHPRDQRIVFVDPGHKYFIDGDGENIISSTAAIHKYFEPFDAYRIAKNIVKSKKWKEDPSYKYYKMTEDDIKKMWDESGREASELGTRMHEKIEYFYNDNEVDVLEDEKEFEYFLDFYEDHKHLNIYRTEWYIFADDLRIAGSIDATFINNDGTLTLMDWKRSKEIKFNSFNNKKARDPLGHLPDCNYSQYSLQLNLYRRILQDYYDFTVTDMYLVVCHPNNKGYIKIPVTIMDTEIDLILEERRQYIKQIYS